LGGGHHRWRAASGSRERQGIETQEQRAAVEQLGCDRDAGRGCRAPLPADGIAPAAAREKRSRVETQRRLRFL